jgi:hypothetical protein
MDCISLGTGYDRLRYMQLAKEDEELADMLGKVPAGHGDFGGMRVSWIIVRGGNMM